MYRFLLYSHCKSSYPMLPFFYRATTPEYNKALYLKHIKSTMKLCFTKESPNRVQMAGYNYKFKAMPADAQGRSDTCTRSLPYCFCFRPALRKK